MKTFLKRFLIAVVILVAVLALLSIRKISPPDDINYGVSFSVFHANELHLDWKTTYDAILNDLGVRMFRFSAHWPLTEPRKGKFNWVELDYQISQAEKVNATAVLAVGRRLPGWPECHEPDWAKGLSTTDKQTEILTYISAVVNRYKDSKAISKWQVENEPFLTMFATYDCGDFLTKDFLQTEIQTIKKIDPTRPILVTDSGELSTWYNAYNAGDEFGTSVYVYVWTHQLGPIRYPITPAFFRIKTNLVELFNGKKPESLIELSAEPWLLQPIADTPIDTQLSRMDINKFNNVIEFAQKTGFKDQYLWGAEWWYYMKQNGHPEFWEGAKELFSSNN